MSRLSRALGLGAATAWLCACPGPLEGVGVPCQRFTDCESGLICDYHPREGGEGAVAVGSCQQPHDHADESESESEGESGGEVSAF